MKTSEKYSKEAKNWTISWIFITLITTVLAYLDYKAGVPNTLFFLLFGAYILASMNSILNIYKCRSYARIIKLEEECIVIKKK